MDFRGDICDNFEHYLVEIFVGSDLHLISVNRDVCVYFIVSFYMYFFVDLHLFVQCIDTNLTLVWYFV